MTTPILELLRTSHAAGLVLRVHGGQVWWTASGDQPRPELLDQLRAVKPTLIDVLSRVEAMRRHMALPRRLPVSRCGDRALSIPGLCWSCHAPLCHVRAVGRCDLCEVAVEWVHRSSTFSPALREDVRATA